MAACAQIETNADEHFVLNMVEVAPQDFDWLLSIWHDFYPTQYIKWADELVPEPGSPGVVWIGWRQRPSGEWYDPTWVVLPPEEQAARLAAKAVA